MTTGSWNPAMQRRPEQISPVESHLVYWLNYVGYRLTHELRLRASQFGVTAAEWVILRKLYGEDAMPSRLARRLGLNRSTISRLGVRLEAKGLIHRDKSLSDRRTLTLRLTEKARALMPVLAGAADRNNARHFAVAGEAPLETIERVIKGIVYRRRFRFVPPDRCRVRKYRYLHLGLDWEGDEDEDGAGEGEEEGDGDG
jgi:DNA-binding MarR family transcriptional regulator